MPPGVEPPDPSSAASAPQAALVWDDDLSRYGFERAHPMNPRRLALTVELIRALGLAGDALRPILPPRLATTDELLLVHDRAFVVAVGAPSPRRRFG